MTFQRIPTEGDPKPFRVGERGLGSTWAGSSDPVTRVHITRPFFLGTFPVTQAQLLAMRTVTKGDRFEQTNASAGDRDHPAECSEWLDAVRFCQWLNAAGFLPQGWLACLPTEAEWEYACRAGTDTEYYTGNGESALSEAGWFEKNSSSSLKAVGRKRPNQFGLYDMHGNAWECCFDRFVEHAYCTLVDGVRDPGRVARDTFFMSNDEAGTDDETERVLRGGSVQYPAGDCRSAFRYWNGPDFQFRSSGFGFRVCLVHGPSKIERGES